MIFLGGLIKVNFEEHWKSRTKAASFSRAHVTSEQPHQDEPSAGVPREVVAAMPSLQEPISTHCRCRGEGGAPQKGASI